MLRGPWNSLDHPCLESWLARLREADALNLLPSLDEIKQDYKNRKNKKRLAMSPQGCFDIAIGRHYKGRCLFRTKTGYLGLGPKAVEPRDEVWLVSGARTPLILRRLSSRDWRSAVRDVFVQQKHSNSRTFIGESYVHGIMNGGTLRFLSSTVSLVSLV